MPAVRLHAGGARRRIDDYGRLHQTELSRLPDCALETSFALRDVWTRRKLVAGYA